jgi:glycosyltransferase involved in cell wall biosynthesis
MSAPPSVSVVVPAYNAAHTLGVCLSALSSQDYPAGLYEVIVVDDGSSDSTRETIKGFRVRYARQENRGPATARNRGAAMASGEILLFTDSDCVPDQGWMREMVAPFGDPEVMAVKGAYRTEQRSVVARFSQIEFEERFEMLKRASSIDMVDTYSAGFRKKAFDGMKGFDTSFPAANNEDTELSYRMSMAGFRMVFNPRAVVRHLNHPATVARYSRLKFWRGYWRIAVYRRYPGKMLKDTYTPQTLKLQTLCVYLGAALAPLAAFFPGYVIYPLALVALSFVALSLPFTLRAMRRDLLVGLLSPAMLFVRAASIGLGAIWGFASGG